MLIYFVKRKMFIPFKHLKPIRDHNKLYSFVYMTTNNINGKIYIGVHTTNNIYDSYLGGGTYINKAIKKYGRKNFTREILKFTLTKKQALQIEKYIVNNIFIADSRNYNIKVGGQAGVVLTDESRKKMSESSKKRMLLFSKESLSNIMSNIAKKDHWTKEKKECWQNKLSVALKNSERSKIANSNIYNNLSTEKKIQRNKLISERKKEFYKNMQHEDKVNSLKSATEASKRKIQCEYCGKISNTGNYARWHGKNCRKK